METIKTLEKICKNCSIKYNAKTRQKKCGDCRNNLQLCYCRCKKYTKYGRKYIQGHNLRVKLPWKGKDPWNKGMKMPEEFVQKNREGHLGKPSYVRTDTTKQKHSKIMFEKWTIEEFREKQKLSKLTIAPPPKGPDHWNFKGKCIFPAWAIGLWRKLVFEKDKYTCQWCGRRGGSLEANHVISKWENVALIYVVSNGQTLCRSCHKKTSNFGCKARRRPKEFQLPLPLIIV